MPRFKLTLPRAVVAFVLISSPAMAEMTLQLPGIKDATFPADQVLSGFGCHGKNLSPEMVWADAPPATKSFIVTTYDPDAPTGSGFWHWAAFNIPASVTGLNQAAGSADGTMPQGSVMARNDFSDNLYDGACPPEGSTHRYVVTVFAMPMETLPLDATASSAMVGFFANTASLARASVTVSYGR